MTQTNTPTRQGLTTLRALTSLAAAVAVVVGVPIGLAHYVGWPLPHTLPTIGQIRLAVELRDFSDRLLIGTLAVVVWIAWAITTTSLAVHTVAAIRRITIPTPRIVPAALHRVVGRWIGSAALLVTMLSRPAGAATPATTIVAAASPVSSPTSTSSAPVIPRTSAPTKTAVPADSTRTYRVSPRDSLWSVAEATLGDGGRWREILDANRQLITDPDILDDGIELTIPAATSNANGSTVEVKRGDNLWTISRTALATSDDHVTNAEIVPFWKNVIAENREHLRSGNPNLIYPGEEITLPAIPNAPAEPFVQDTATTPAPKAEVPVPLAATVAAAAPMAIATVTSVVDTSPAPAEHSSASQHDESQAPWMLALGLTGVAAASVLAALAAKRRRIATEHRSGDSVHKLTAPERTLTTELRGIAKPDRITQVDRTLRYLYAQCADSGRIPAMSIIRSGSNSVELLADDAAATRPDGFLLLDDATLVVDPATTDDAIDDAQRDALPLCPALVTVGSDETGDVFVDLERIGALAIEADTPQRSVAALTHIAIEQAGLPWATDNTLFTLGLELPQGIASRCTAITSPKAFLEQNRPYAGEERRGPAHEARLEGLELLPPTIVLVGPGHDEFARDLAEIACQPGSSVALVAAAPLAASHWRLVITNTTAQLEPCGLNLSPIGLVVAAIDPEPAAKIDELVFRGDEERSANDETDRGVESSGEESANDDELEPVDEVIARILEPRLVELSILGAAPELRGVQWNGKTAARADEVVTFLMLHGPATPRQLGEALWPGKRNTAQQVSQAVSRARTLLGEEAGEPRLPEARRNTPYRITNIGCDWQRFEDLVDACKGRCADDRRMLLTAALDMVKATPFAARRERSFEWVADLGFELEIALAITAAAEEAAELAISAGDPDVALAAVDRGRHAVPTHENLTRLRIRALAVAGDSDAVRLEYEAARHRIEQDEGLLADLDPDTQALFESVLR